MERIKIGQIGVGHAHASKLGVYLKSPDYEVVGLVEPDPKLQPLARRGVFENVPLMTREQLFNTPGLKAVLVETEVRDLLDQAEACVSAGLHVHLDKPAGQSLPQYERLLDEAARRHLMVQMGYMYRFNPAVLMLHDFLRKGWLGRPFEMHTVMSKVVPPASRAALAEYPGGILFELGCHILDLTLGVLGEPTRVAGFHRHSAAELDDGLVDNMLAVLEYENAVATVKSSALEVEGFARRHLTVCGDEGTFHMQPLDRPAVRVAFSKPRGDHPRGYQEISLEPYSRYVGDAAEMAAVIRGQQDPLHSYHHDLAVQRTLLRACQLPVR